MLSALTTSIASKEGFHWILYIHPDLFSARLSPKSAPQLCPCWGGDQGEPRKAWISALSHALGLTFQSAGNHSFAGRVFVTDPWGRNFWDWNPDLLIEGVHWGLQRGMKGLNMNRLESLHPGEWEIVASLTGSRWRTPFRLGEP